MKIKSLQVKIAFWAGLCLLLTGAILITLSVTTLRERDSALAIKDAREAVREKADVIQNKLRVGLLTARTLAETLGQGPESRFEVAAAPGERHFADGPGKQRQFQCDLHGLGT